MPDDALYRPWGTVTPSFWEGHTARPNAEESPVPQDLRDELASIAAAAAAGQLEDASAAAQRLDARITSQYGEAHLFTVHMREVRAHLAHLGGDRPGAIAWYLHTTRLRADVQGHDHPDTEHATRLVYSLWRALPPAEAHRLGPELIAVLTEIQGPDSTLTTRVRQLVTPGADATAATP